MANAVRCVRDFVVKIARAIELHAVARCVNQQKALEARHDTAEFLNKRCRRSGKTRKRCIEQELRVIAIGERLELAKRCGKLTLGKRLANGRECFDEAR